MASNKAMLIDSSSTDINSLRANFVFLLISLLELVSSGEYGDVVGMVEVQKYKRNFKWD